MRPESGVSEAWVCLGFAANELFNFGQVMYSCSLPELEFPILSNKGHFVNHFLLHYSSYTILYLVSDEQFSDSSIIFIIRCSP